MLLRWLIPLWMIRARLQAGQAKFAQPFADRAFADIDREALCDLLAQIATAPANDLMDRGIGTGDDQFTQLFHLRVGQLWLRPGRAPRHQAIRASLVVAVRNVSMTLRHLAFEFRLG
jgi:hypothetical protein